MNKFLEQYPQLREPIVGDIVKIKESKLTSIFELENADNFGTIIDKYVHPTKYLVSTFIKLDEENVRNATTFDVPTNVNITYILDKNDFIIVKYSNTGVE